jgi:hypothetical protein
MEIPKIVKLNQFVKRAMTASGLYIGEVYAMLADETIRWLCYKKIIVTKPNGIAEEIEVTRMVKLPPELERLALESLQREGIVRNVVVRHGHVVMHDAKYPRKAGDRHGQET